MARTRLLHLSLPLSAFAFVGATPQLKFGSTTLSGQAISPTVEFFGGIPFAEPPLGQLRFRPPLLKLRLNASTFDASDYGKSCPQPPLFEGDIPISEDCLTINVHRPVGTKPSAKLPFFFWTYGGAYVIGGSPAYNVANVLFPKAPPVIFVNFNYRLGPLGFPQGQEADDKKILNLGVQDQLAALEWVQANIESFGGDGKKVTAVGESAGSILTSIQYLNPEPFERLARGAIMQSGVANSIFAFKASRNEPSWQKFVGSVPSCASLATSGNTLSCLRNASTGEISAAVLQNIVLEDLAANLNWTPAIDGKIIPDIPSRLIGKGRLANVPFITGTNLDEGTFFTPQRDMTDQDLKEYLVGVISDRKDSRKLESVLDEVLNLYSKDPQAGSPYGTGDELFGLPASFKRAASILGDIAFDGPRRLFLQAAAKQNPKIYVYQFTQPQQAEPALGVRHGIDLDYTFGTLPPSATQGDRDISNDMLDYWISFVVSGDPNDGKGATRAKWPKYTTSNQVLLKLEAGNTEAISDAYRKENIEFLNKNSAVLNH